MSYRIIIVALCIAALALGVTGCQRAVERAVEGATGVKVDQKGESVTVTGDDGEELTISGKGGSLPDDWPSDIPVYPGVELVSSSSMRIGDSAHMTVAWTTSDDVNDAYEWYRDKLPSAGWEITSDFTMEQNGERMANLSSAKGSTEIHIFIGDEHDGSTLITIQARSE